MSEVGFFFLKKTTKKSMADLNYYSLAVLIKTSSANITASHSVSVVDLLRSQNRGAKLRAHAYRLRVLLMCGLRVIY